MSKLRGRKPHTVIVDDLTDEQYDLWQMQIDQLGRVVQRQKVNERNWGCMSRCRACVYFSPVGALLPYSEKHCKYNKYGPVDITKSCGTARWVEVEYAES